MAMGGRVGASLVLQAVAELQCWQLGDIENAFLHLVAGPMRSELSSSVLSAVRCDVCAPGSLLPRPSSIAPLCWLCCISFVSSVQSGQAA